MSDHVAGIAITVFLLLFCGLVAYKVSGLLDALHDERRRVIELTYILDRLTSSGSRQEPTRRDANDPYRSRFAFCGRHPESGHAPDCSWVLAMKAANQIESQPARGQGEGGE